MDTDKDKDIKETTDEKDKDIKNTDKDTEDNEAGNKTDKEKDDDVVSVKKADLDALMEKVVKIADIEKMLKTEQTEKKQLKFENIKQKHNLTDDVCDLLGITADTKEEDITSKIEKFNKIAGVKDNKDTKDSAVFLKTDTTKAGTEDKIQQLIKEGKVGEALALKLQK
ncbi:hypothetical protein EQM05_04280 [Clostridium sp. JN-9]|nr:hypothetical protein EQM05_04280 [Clostridium sp. JN-9]